MSWIIFKVEGDNYVRAVREDQVEMISRNKDGTVTLTVNPGDGEEHYKLSGGKYEFSNNLEDVLERLETKAKS